MQLNTLEIKGFKSFGDKIVIHFDQGITGIVGPNGCGKSNIVDAIRWVLGEQKSRMLRSDKMENVIFNGTSNRKPSQLAEVSLTFSNTKNLLPTEYNQVTITRKYYRSGESEYLLNGVNCRLKDITNLFLDTGIGPDSYAIIELKMIDEILNDKENSRRLLFEEAAGVSKFKIRKKETFRKLEDTDADLARVDDLLFEINKNLKSLEKQARQAEQYLTLKKELRDKSIEWAAVLVQNESHRLEQINQRIKTENDLKTNLSTQLGELNSKSEKVKLDIVHAENLVGSRQKTFNEQINKIRNYESERKIKNERLRYLTERRDALTEQRDSDKKSLERAEFTIKSLQDEAYEITQAVKLIREKVKLLEINYQESKADADMYARDLSMLNETVNAIQQAFYEKSKNLELFQIQLNATKNELEKTTAGEQQKSTSLVDFTSKLKEVTDQLKLETQLFEELNSQETELDQKLLQKTEDIEQLKEDVAKLNRQLDQKQNEYSLTKSLVENLEGFPEAIRFLKKHAEWGKDAPLLSDILTCPEEYKLTIENFLEPYMNYYVVEDERQALQAVEMLSNSAKGRANFFLLNKFEKVKQTSPSFSTQATPAIEVVEFDFAFKNLVSHLLHNVYLTDDKETLLPDQDDVVYLSKNARLTRRKRSISGGSVGLFEGKRIGRAKNLEKLQEEIKNLNSKLSKQRKFLEESQLKWTSLKESSRKQLIAQKREHLYQLQQEQTVLNTRQEEFKHQMLHSAGRRDELMETILTLENTIKKLRPETDGLSATLQNSRVEYQEKQESSRAQSEATLVHFNAYNQENILLIQKENKLSNIENEIEFKKTSSTQAQQRIAVQTNELEQIDQQILQLLASTDESEDVLLEFYKEKEDLESGLREAEQHYYSLRGQVSGFEQESRDIQNKREQCNILLLELQQQQSVAQMAISNTLERIAAESGITAAEISALELHSDSNQENLRRELDEIKAKIERLGVVNPMAKEAYDEMLQRFEFITNQKEDLISARQSLMNTIQEIDAVAQKTFLDSFVQIKQSFIQVFRTLFEEGDTCDLVLVDPSNPLESEIQITAKPKGKRPLTINQLSGGEKTLTATALLFAIYLLKPAPFCIFDEVDAPLDDANIDKFNNIIRTFSSQSQFIIVTHNKRTMSSTDVIYGITMVEKGVSRIVPVDLRSLS